MSATKNLLKSGSFFVVSSIAAGGLNYLFQVFASRDLTAEEFSQLNAWFANLALGFVISGVLQYAANFFPAPKKRLRQGAILVNLVCVLLIWAWLTGDTGLTLSRAIMVLTGAALFGWFMGQIQSRLLFGALSAANLLVGITKITMALLPFGTPLERYSFAFFASYLPAVLLLTIWSWKSEEPTPHENVKSTWMLWSAPIILSIATAVIPQMDLVLMNQIQSAADFQNFARSSLFYKAIYFLMFIFAQWMLPQQIRNRRNTDRPSQSFAPWILTGLAILGSLALTLASPLLVKWIFHWNESPDFSMIFLSCLNMSFLTWLFLLIQEACASRQIHAAGLVLIGIALESLLQLGLKLPPNGYLSLAIVIQSLLIIGLSLAKRNSRDLGIGA